MHHVCYIHAYLVHNDPYYSLHHVLPIPACPQPLPGACTITINPNIHMLKKHLPMPAHYNMEATAI